MAAAWATRLRRDIVRHVSRDQQSLQDDLDAVLGPVPPNFDPGATTATTVTTPASRTPATTVASLSGAAPPPPPHGDALGLHLRLHRLQQLQRKADGAQNGSSDGAPEDPAAARGDDLTHLMVLAGGAGAGPGTVTAAASLRPARSLVSQASSGSGVLVGPPTAQAYAPPRLTSWRAAASDGGDGHGGALGGDALPLQAQAAGGVLGRPNSHTGAAVAGLDRPAAASDGGRSVGSAPAAAAGVACGGAPWVAAAAALRLGGGEEADGVCGVPLARLLESAQHSPVRLSGLRRQHSQPGDGSAGAAGGGSEEQVAGGTLPVGAIAARLFGAGADGRQGAAAVLQGCGSGPAELEPHHGSGSEQDGGIAAALARRVAATAAALPHSRSDAALLQHHHDPALLAAGPHLHHAHSAAAPPPAPPPSPPLLAADAASLPAPPPPPLAHPAPLDFARDVVLQRKMGSGAFGSVYSALWHNPPDSALCMLGFPGAFSAPVPGGAQEQQAQQQQQRPAAVRVAVKVVPLMLDAANYSARSLDALRQEVQVLSRVAHPHVVRFLGACLAPPNVCIVEQLAEGGSLHAVIHHPHQQAEAVGGEAGGWGAAAPPRSALPAAAERVARMLRGEGAAVGGGEGGLDLRQVRLCVRGNAAQAARAACSFEAAASLRARSRCAWRATARAAGAEAGRRGRERHAPFARERRRAPRPQVGQRAPGRARHGAGGRLRHLALPGHRPHGPQHAQRARRDARLHGELEVLAARCSARDGGDMAERVPCPTVRRRRSSLRGGAC